MPFAEGTLVNSALEPPPSLAVLTAEQPLSAAVAELVHGVLSAAAQPIARLPDPAAADEARRLLRRVCALLLLARPATTASQYAGMREVLDGLELALAAARQPAADLAALDQVRRRGDDAGEMAALEAAIGRARAASAPPPPAPAQMARRLRRVGEALVRSLPTELFLSTLAEGLAQSYQWADAARGAVERAVLAPRVRDWARALDVLAVELSFLGESRDLIPRAREDAELGGDLLALAELAWTLDEAAAAEIAARCDEAGRRRVGRALRRTEPVFGHTAECFSEGLVQRLRGGCG